MTTPRWEEIRNYLQGLQSDLIRELRALDPEVEFRDDPWEREAGGGGQTKVISNGQLWEKGGVNFSEVYGSGLPPSATKERPELAGRAFKAMGVSVVIHPQNPYIPTTHMNVRFFSTTDDDPIWWFGGGFDLTPYYPFEDDAVSWHQTAKEACDRVDSTLYSKFKDTCDSYFYLKHRDETRGVGGLFFDDFNASGFEASFRLMRAVGDAFWQAYHPIVKKRQVTPYGDRERQWQLYRRGRYVEFNLLYDRGTLFGLQSGGRTESILMSLPPLARWDYLPKIEADSHEASLARDFLRPRDWLDLDAQG